MWQYGYYTVDTFSADVDWMKRSMLTNNFVTKIYDIGGDLDYNMWQYGYNAVGHIFYRCGLCEK